MKTQLVRVAEVAELLTLSRSKVYQLMETGDLPYVRFGKSRRVPLEAVDRLILRNTVGKQK